MSAMFRSGVRDEWRSLKKSLASDVLFPASLDSVSFEEAPDGVKRPHGVKRQIPVAIPPFAYLHGLLRDSSSNSIFADIPEVGAAAKTAPLLPVRLPGTAPPALPARPSAKLHKPPLPRRGPTPSLMGKATPPPTRPPPPPRPISGLSPPQLSTRLSSDLSSTDDDDDERRLFDFLSA